MFVNYVYSVTNYVWNWITDKIINNNWQTCNALHPGWDFSANFNYCK